MGTIIPFGNAKETLRKREGGQSAMTAVERFRANNPDCDKPMTDKEFLDSFSMRNTDDDFSEVLERFPEPDKNSEIFKHLVETFDIRK